MFLNLFLLVSDQQWQKNPTFPSQLNDPLNFTLRTDIVNFLTDGTLPKTNNLTYSQVILVWGQLIYLHRDEIGNGSFRFNGKDIIIPQTIHAPSGIIISKPPVIRPANTDPKLKSANNMIQNGAPSNPTSVQTTGGQ